LKNCEEVCKYAVTFGEDKISDDVLKEALELDEEKIPKKTVEAVKKTIEKQVEKKVEKTMDKKTILREKKAIKEEKAKVYNPEENLYVGSAEEMLDKDTDELFSDEQYF